MVTAKDYLRLFIVLKMPKANTQKYSTVGYTTNYNIQYYNQNHNHFG